MSGNRYIFLIFRNVFFSIAKYNVFLITKLVQYILHFYCANCAKIIISDFLLPFANLGINNFSRKGEVSYKKNEKVQFFINLTWLFYKQRLDSMKYASFWHSAKSYKIIKHIHMYRNANVFYFSTCINLHLT